MNDVTILAIGRRIRVQRWALRSWRITNDERVFAVDAGRYSFIFRKRSALDAEDRLKVRNGN